MAKTKTVYTAPSAAAPRRAGRASAQCNAWNTLVETVADSVVRGTPFPAAGDVRRGAQAVGDRGGRRAALLDRHRRIRPRAGRRPGGGRRGADRRRPGIGKSTLLLQALANLSASRRVLYVSGEESAAQIALRAQRLGVEAATLGLLPEIQLEKIQATLEADKPEVAVIDSIQTATRRR
jgi:DNA repair protein RadA/Sms